MARIIYPEEFAAQQTLFTAILAQHTSLGTKSPLIPFAKQRKMDLAKLQAAIALAAVKDKESKALKRDSENKTQQRDLALAVPWAHLLAEVQFLKKFFAGSERELGAWGITVDATSRIVYPPGLAERMALIQAFIQKHQSYPAGESPLQMYIDEHDIDVDADLEAAGNALADESDRNKLTGDSELATQQRNTLWEPVVTAIHLIGNFLMGLYHDDSRKMGAWGFVVAADAAGKREQISIINPASAKELKSIKIPGVLKNIGTEAVEVIKGKGEKAVITTVLPGKELGMTKGYSRITVKNSSTLAIAHVQVTVSK